MTMEVHEMDELQDDMKQVLEEESFGDVTAHLKAWVQQVGTPEGADRSALETILKNVARQLPANSATWADDPLARRCA